MWTQDGGKQNNNAVAADASAIHRGGALYVDEASLQQELIPWLSGSDDRITLDFILPGAIENVATTPVGWEGTVAGTNWRAGVADLDGVKGLGKLSTALDAFSAPGSQSYVRIPFDEVPASGEWRPVQKQLGGNWQDFNFFIQSALTQEEIDDGASQYDWVPGSIAIYHKTKRNDKPAFKYTTGKAAHMPAPIAVGFRSNGITITGWTYGSFEVDEITGVITKVFDTSVIQSWNNTDTVVMDATLGYTTIGGNELTNQQGYVTGPFIMPEDGNMVNITARIRVVSSTIEAWIALYGGGSLTDPTVQTLIPDSGVGDQAIDNVFSWQEFIPPSPPHLSSGSDIWIGVGANLIDVWIRYDTGQTGFFIGRDDFQAGSTPPPDTSLFGATLVNFVFSAYVTYTPGAPTSPPTINSILLTPSTTPQGSDVDLSASASDVDHTITEMEYFIGADPGEGLATPMVLGAGTVNRTGTAVIDTSGLSLGANAVFVRAKDGTDGWGNTDFSFLTVEEAIIPASGGIGTGIGIGI